MVCPSLSELVGQKRDHAGQRDEEDDGADHDVDDVGGGAHGELHALAAVDEAAEQQAGEDAADGAGRGIPCRRSPGL